MAKLAPLLAFTLDREGGYQCARSDGGNWTGGRPGWGRLVGTNRGISAPVLLARCRRLNNDHTLMISAADMRALSEAEADAIYVDEYATPLAAVLLPAGADLVLFDGAVQHGVAATAELAQGVVGALQDGDIGPATRAAIDAHGVPRFIDDFTAAFETMLRGCALFAVDGRGWLARNTLRQAVAHAMWANSQ